MCKKSIVNIEKIIKNDKGSNVVEYVICMTIIAIGSITYLKNTRNAINSQLVDTASEMRARTSS